MCEYCKDVEWQTDDPRDRDLLLGKTFIGGNFAIDKGSILSFEYNIGYFLVKSRNKINYCPMCGKKLEE